MYCDLLEFYVEARSVLLNKEGKSSCEYVFRDKVIIVNGYSPSTSDVYGFKHFLRTTWEPFEAGFLSIETRFINHVEVVIHLANEHRDSSLGALDNQNKPGEFFDCFWCQLLIPS